MLMALWLPMQVLLVHVLPMQLLLMQMVLDKQLMELDGCACVCVCSALLNRG